MPLPPISILYGSATGNAEHIAKDFAANIPPSGSFYSSVICCEMDQFKKKCQKNWDVESDHGKHPIVAITSTTGNGDAPENAGRFVRFLKRKTSVEAQPFKHCAFAVLALGDTNYDQFCATGKLVDKKMEELGGTRAKAVGLADEGTGLEDVVEPWIETVMEAMRIASTAGFAGEIEEEKQSEADENVVPSAAKKSNPQRVEETKTETISAKNLSPGLTVLQALATANNIQWPLPNPDNSTLPSLTAAMSSCALISKDNVDNTNLVSAGTTEEHMSYASGSSLSHTFNMQNPYAAPILGARYLTQTSTDPASKAAATLLSTSSLHQASAHFTEGFHVATNPKDGKRVIELTLGIPDDFSLEYEPGDSIGMLVTNECSSSFQIVLNLLQTTHNIDVRTQLVKIDEGEPIPIYDAIAKNIDITSVVKKRILASLAQWTKDPTESSALRLLSSKTPEGETLYQELVVKKVLNFGNILDLFPSCQPTLPDILSVCDGMTPRYYSVCSSPLAHSDRLSVAFSVVDYEVAHDIYPTDGTTLSCRRGGLATQYLEVQCAPWLANNGTSTIPTTLSIFPKPTADFRLPQSISTPLVLIGPGTGVAPFLGFLSHRRALWREKRDLETQAEQGTWRGDFEIEEAGEKKDDDDCYDGEGGDNYDSEDYGAKTLLFFGCRWADHDFLFEKELQAFLKKGTLSHLYKAFSRSSEKKQYVQDMMKNVASELAHMICKQNASVYICGDGNNMGKQVQECIADILEKHGDKLSSGKVQVEEMKKKNKLLLDIWS